MLRADFQRLTRIRLREARRLLAHREFCGAYYFTGMAVECAIKSCIARRTQRYEFPDRAYAQQCWEHDPTKLIKVAGLEHLLAAECNAVPMFGANWGVVKDWYNNCRYDHSIDRILARGLYSAVVSRKYGVLPWLRQHW